ncbi:hypothetical protein BJ138DRAFT_979820, partial [Hygrophoropsis aurantiaca]
MEDATITPPKNIADNVAKKPKAQITSSLTQTTNSNDIVTCILSTPLTLSVGEVIGVSKDVSQHLQDLIRFKR